MVGVAPDLWAGTYLPHTFPERLEVARAGDFSRLSLFPDDYRRAIAAGESAQDILALHESYGVRLTSLDAFARWLPRWEPWPDTPDLRMRIIDAEEAEFFAIAESLQLQTVTAIEPFGTRYPLDVLVDSFERLCRRAGDHGLEVQLEFTPYSGIPDLRTAWDIVRHAAQPNGGLIFDSWHFTYGDPDYELLAEVPGTAIRAVQVNDGPRSVGGPLASQGWGQRRLPGEGDFDLARMLRVLTAKPDVGPIGIETLSQELWAMSPADVGRRARDAVTRVLALIS